MSYSTASERHCQGHLQAWKIKYGNFDVWISLNRNKSLLELIDILKRNSEVVN